jgi:hypothetical protein
MLNGLIEKFGNKFWYQDDQLHRLDGPAVEYTNGTKYWYQSGKIHRLDGPACECYNDTKYWYYQGKLVDCKSQEEFERLIKLKIFW